MQRREHVLDIIQQQCKTGYCRCLNREPTSNLVYLPCIRPKFLLEKPGSHASMHFVHAPPTKILLTGIWTDYNERQHLSFRASLWIPRDKATY